MNSSLTDRGRSRAVGLCLHQPRSRVPLEPFWMQFIRGAESRLITTGFSLVLQVVSGAEEEEATYRRWHAAGEITGVMVVDLVTDDRRFALLADLGMPAVLLGNVESTEFGVVTTDAVPPMNEVMDHLAAKGHRAVTRITGPAQFQHTIERDDAFRAAGERLGIRTECVVSDYTAVGGAEATAAALASHPETTALVYDNDVMAVAGLDVLHSAGRRVPDEIAVIAWDDSLQCQLASPPLSATYRDLVAYGESAADTLVDLVVAGRVVTRATTPSVLIERASSAAQVGEDAA